MLKFMEASNELLIFYLFDTYINISFSVGNVCMFYHIVQYVKSNLYVCDLYLIGANIVEFQRICLLVIFLKFSTPKMQIY